MIYLFCSASRPLYKRDALESTCYPPGHLFRFRYEKTYVDPQIWRCPGNFERKEGVIIFLDTIGKEGGKDFDFFPVRKVKTVRLFLEGLAIYIDFKFGDFINYGSEDNDDRRMTWLHFFQELENRPWPPPIESGRNERAFQGYFIMSNLKHNPAFPTKSPIMHGAWESLIRRLNNTNNLKDSTFFQILGFYDIKKRFLVAGSFSEIPIKSEDNSYDSIYPLPMGKSVVLKLLFSRPTYKLEDRKGRRALKLNAGTESFAGVSKDVFYSESRYNEERIVLICKRVFDSILSTVSIEQQNEPNDIQSPKPFLLTRIKVPRFIIGLVILGVVLSTLLVGLDADSIELIGSWILSSQATYFQQNAKVFAALGKLISPIPIGVSAYYAFRRLPLKR